MNFTMSESRFKLFCIPFFVLYNVEESDRFCLTNTGTDKHIIGHFRPNLLAINPKKGKAISWPIESKDAIQDDCSIVILPVGRGDWSEVSRKMAGDAQPEFKPNTLPKTIAIAEIEFKIKESVICRL